MNACVLACLLIGADEKKGLEGFWQGTLKLPGRDLRFVLKFTKKADKLEGVLDSLDEGLAGLPLSSIEVKGDDVRFELKLTKAIVEGKFDAAHSELKGEWKQGPKPLPIVFKRTDKPAELKRPQTPMKPFPYDEEEVVFENKKAGVKLAGTLTLPKGKAKAPAVLLVTGSGPQDRDETIFGHKPFMVIADHLTRRGIAVLRYDDRGVGKSTGFHILGTTADFADDARAGIAFLKKHDRIDPERVGLAGHSEGGIIGASLGATKDVAFLVLLAGSAFPGEDILKQQGQAIVKASGGDKEQQRRQLVFHELGFKAIKAHKDNAKALSMFKTEMKAELEKADLMGVKIEDALKGLESGFRVLSSPWFRHFIAHDPRPDLQKTTCPVLAVIGEKDLQILPGDNLPEFKKTLKDNKDATVKELPKLNHLFQTCKTGLVSEYGRSEETFSPAALELVGEWIESRVKDSLARKIVQRCARIADGHLVQISGPARDAALLEDLAVEVSRLGGDPLLTLQPSHPAARRILAASPEKHDARPSPLSLKLAESMDALIAIEDDPAAEGAYEGIAGKRVQARTAAAVKVQEAMQRRNVRVVSLGNGLYPTEKRASALGLKREALAKLYEAGLDADYAAMGKTGERLRKILAAGGKVRLTSPDGTDVTFRIGKSVLVSDGILSDEKLKKGGAACQVWLPAGEVYTTVEPGSAEGKVVIPLSLWEGKPVKGLVLGFKKGKMTRITAESGLERLKENWEAGGEGRDDLSYLDLGINPAVRLPKGSPGVYMESGMVTVGTGSNVWAGGENKSPFGLACHVRGGTLTVDGKAVVKDGKLVE